MWKKIWKIPFSGETEWTFLFLCVKPWKIKFSQDFFYFFIVRLSNLIDHKRLNFFGFMHEIKKCPEKNIYIFPLSHKKFCWKELERREPNVDLKKGHQKKRNPHLLGQINAKGSLE